jgi:hypothetical protein
MSDSDNARDLLSGLMSSQQNTIDGLMRVIEELMIERKQNRDRVTSLLQSNNEFEARARAAEKFVRELLSKLEAVPAISSGYSDAPFDKPPGWDEVARSNSEALAADMADTGFSDLPE